MNGMQSVGYQRGPVGAIAGYDGQKTAVPKPPIDAALQEIATYLAQINKLTGIIEETVDRLVGSAPVGTQANGSAGTPAPTNLLSRAQMAAQMANAVTTGLQNAVDRLRNFA